MDVGDGFSGWEMKMMQQSKMCRRIGEVGEGKKKLRGRMEG